MCLNEAMNESCLLCGSCQKEWVPNVYDMRFIVNVYCIPLSDYRVVTLIVCAENHVYYTSMLLSR